MITYSEYKIDDVGIYTTSNGYYDDVDTHYWVLFNVPDSRAQLHSFINKIKLEGAEWRSKEIGRLLGVRN